MEVWLFIDGVWEIYPHDCPWEEHAAKHFAAVVVGVGTHPIDGRTIDAAAVVDADQHRIVGWEPSDGSRGDPFGAAWDHAFTHETVGESVCP